MSANNPERGPVVVTSIIFRKLRIVRNNMNVRAKKYRQPKIYTKNLISLVEESGLICGYCGGQLRIYEDNRCHKDALSFDHRLSMALGGANDVSNIVVCCHKCNDEKNWVEVQQREATGLQTNGRVSL